MNILYRKDLETINLKLKLLLDSYLDQVIGIETFQNKKLELVSKKKTIEEQILSLKRSQGNWLEPATPEQRTPRGWAKRLVRTSCRPDRSQLGDR